MIKLPAIINEKDEKVCHNYKLACDFYEERAAVLDKYKFSVVVGIMDSRCADVMLISFTEDAMREIVKAQRFVTGSKAAHVVLSLDGMVNAVLTQKNPSLRVSVVVMATKFFVRMHCTELGSYAQDHVDSYSFSFDELGVQVDVPKPAIQVHLEEEAPVMLVTAQGLEGLGSDIGYTVYVHSEACAEFHRDIGEGETLVTLNMMGREYTDVYPGDSDYVVVTDVEEKGGEA